MGTRYRKMWMQSVVTGHPQFWVSPPARIFGADISETIVNSLMAAAGTCVASGGIQVVTAGRFDFVISVAWGGIALGTVLLAPVIGDVLADLASDIHQGWERGHVEPEPEPEPEPEQEPEPSEDDAGAAKMEGEWWYRSESGRLCCYSTPRDKHRRPIISDARMIAVFSSIIKNGVPFSETEITKRVSGLSGPRFRILQRDWRIRELYRLMPDRTGNFTRTGKLIANVIANYNPPALP